MGHQAEATSAVRAMFGHRFALEGTTAGREGRILADLDPKGAAGFSLQPGDRVSVAGEGKLSELRVTRLTLLDGTVRTIAWPRKPHHDKGGDAPADPAPAIAAVMARRYVLVGEPRRKPKHFEIVGTKDGTRHESTSNSTDGFARRSRAKPRRRRLCG